MYAVVPRLEDLDEWEDDLQGAEYGDSFTAMVEMDHDDFEVGTSKLSEWNVMILQIRRRQLHGHD
ncbi:hypothetical protein CEK25_003655 [Fusarium fujikuroi]|nr:hypothetical protein CEK25_003655 [Fusarium fujikuroi]